MSIEDEQGKASSYFHPLGVEEKNTVALSLVAFMFSPSTGCPQKVDILNVHISEMVTSPGLEAVTSRRESEPVSKCCIWTPGVVGGQVQLAGPDQR